MNDAIAQQILQELKTISGTLMNMNANLGKIVKR